MMLACPLQNKVCLGILLALASCFAQNTVASENEGNSTGPPSVENWVEYYRYVATDELDSFDRKVLDSCNKKSTGSNFFGMPTVSELIATRLAFNQAQAAIRNETKENYTELDSISNTVMRQKLFYLRRRGPSNMDSEKLEQMIEIGSNMENAFRNTLVCRYDGSWEPSSCSKIGANRPADLLTGGAQASLNDEKFQNYWTVRQDAIAAATSVETYKQFIELLNEHAQAAGYKGADEVWTAAYNDGNRSISLGDFKDQLYSISAELRPFYEKLHAYVRMKLRNSRYGSHTSQFIPANILGNVNSGNWDSLTAFTMPFDSEGNPLEPGSNDRVIRDDRDKNGGSCWSPRFCYERATEVRQKTCQDQFDDEERRQDPTKYVSDSSIWHGSYMLESGLNFGFHHAVVDSHALAFNYRKYMNCKAGMEFPSYVYCSKQPKKPSPNSTANLNYLYRTALYKVVPLVHTIAVLDWKFGVLNGTVSPEEYNSKWWETLRQHQGVVPPNDRSNSSGLDAAADIAIASNTEQSHEFIRQVLTFQLFQFLCNDSGQDSIDDASSEPLHQCNLIKMDDSFQRLAMLGMSRPYSNVLNELTGTNRLSAQPIINYFKPLFTFLDEELAKAGESPGFLEGPIVQRSTDRSQNVSNASGVDSEPYAGSESDGDVGMLSGIQDLFSMLRAIMM